jgi:hypothetical protein
VIAAVDRCDPGNHAVQIGEDEPFGGDNLDLAFFAQGVKPLITVA